MWIRVPDSSRIPISFTETIPGATEGGRERERRERDAARNKSLLLLLLLPWSSLNPMSLSNFPCTLRNQENFYSVIGYTPLNDSRGKGTAVPEHLWVLVLLLVRLVPPVPVSQ